MTNIYDTYLEAEVLGADPIKLVHMLYRGAGEAVAAARRHLAAGDIRQRSRQITKVWEILFELSRSLDHERGADISRRLSELYTYMQRRLLEANAQQSDAPLAEVESLLATLSEAWASANFPAPPPAEVEAYEPLSCVY
ncbi:MAG TPA: flagellar export chaperone FliS [Bryobacteraceae bacterium]|jgi:flagellar protein FliS